jgi:hypothetical protein
MQLNLEFADNTLHSGKKFEDSLGVREDRADVGGD